MNPTIDEVKPSAPLSTSSPFWQSHDTGLKSYRISVWDEMPRTGLPELFESYAEFERFVESRDIRTAGLAHVGSTAAPAAPLASIAVGASDPGSWISQKPSPPIAFR